MGCALSHQSLIKTIAYSHILWRHFLTWGSLCSDDLVWVKLTLKLASKQGNLKIPIDQGRENDYFSWSENKVEEFITTLCLQFSIKQKGEYLIEKIWVSSPKITANLYSMEKPLLNITMEALICRLGRGNLNIDIRVEEIIIAFLYHVNYQIYLSNCFFLWQQ